MSQSRSHCPAGHAALWAARSTAKEILPMMRSSRATLLGIVAVLGLWPFVTRAQDRLKLMPGYDQHQKMSKAIPGSVKLGSLAVTWRDGGKAFEYEYNGNAYRYDIA